MFFKRVARMLLTVAASVTLGWPGQIFAGPVILGGDDLTDHGSRSATGQNLEGWLYIEKAIGNLNTNQTRPGTLTTTIAALGSSNPGAGVYPASNAGGAINSAANVLGLSVSFFDTAAGINSFFTNLSAGTVNPAILWLAGTGAINNLDSAEGAALTANAAAINNFVASGGGLMAHGSGTAAYGWLSALLPGIVENNGACNSTGATLTAAGNAAFPGLSNANIDANAGPCHSSFTGNLGGLSVLALDGNGLNYIIGTGQGGLIQCGTPGQPVCPPPPGTNGGAVPEPGTVLLLGSGLFGLAAWRRRFQRQR
jgi:hypothetical protein